MKLDLGVGSPKEGSEDLKKNLKEGRRIFVRGAIPLETGKFFYCAIDFHSRHFVLLLLWHCLFVGRHQVASCYFKSSF
jgi:hypothetical protein